MSGQSLQDKIGVLSIYYRSINSRLKLTFLPEGLYVYWGKKRSKLVRKESQEDKILIEDLMGVSRVSLSMATAWKARTE